MTVLKNILIVIAIMFATLIWFKLINVHYENQLEQNIEDTQKR